MWIVDQPDAAYVRTATEILSAHYRSSGKRLSLPKELETIRVGVRDADPTQAALGLEKALGLVNESKDPQEIRLRFRNPNADEALLKTDLKEALARNNMDREIISAIPRWPTRIGQILVGRMPVSKLPELRHIHQSGPPDRPVWDPSGYAAYMISCEVGLCIVKLGIYDRAGGLITDRYIELASPVTKTDQVSLGVAGDHKLWDFFRNSATSGGFDEREPARPNLVRRFGEDLVDREVKQSLFGPLIERWDDPGPRLWILPVEMLYSMAGITYAEQQWPLVKSVPLGFQLITESVNGVTVVRPRYRAQMIGPKPFLSLKSTVGPAELAPWVATYQSVTGFSMFEGQLLRRWTLEADRRVVSRWEDIGELRFLGTFSNPLADRTMLIGQLTLAQRERLIATFADDFVNLPALTSPKFLNGKLSIRPTELDQLFWHDGLKGIGFPGGTTDHFSLQSVAYYAADRVQELGGKLSRSQIMELLRPAQVREPGLSIEVEVEGFKLKTEIRTAFLEGPVPYKSFDKLPTAMQASFWKSFEKAMERRPRWGG